MERTPRSPITGGYKMSTVNVNARGSEAEVVFIEETTAGTTPTTGTVYKLRHGGEDFDANRPTEFDADIETNGMKQSSVRQLNTLQGGFNFQPSNGAQNLFYLSGLQRSAYTTDSYADTVDITASGDGETATVTFSGAVSISTIINNGPIKLAGTASNNAIVRVSAVDDGAGTITLGKVNNEQADFVTESAASLTATQVYIKNGGRDVKTFTVEKRLTSINTDNGNYRLSGERVGQLNWQVATGGAITGRCDMMGIDDAQANDGIVGPYDWTVTSNTSAGTDTVPIQNGTTDLAAGDVVYIEGDVSNSQYIVESYSAPNVVFTTNLQEDVTAADKLYITRPATELGDDQKMENNLGYTTIDGSRFCITSGNITANANLTPLNCVGDENAIDFNVGDREVTGTIVPYFSTNIQSIITKIRNGTKFPIVILIL